MRDIDKVIVLGSGTSISSLSANEINYINRCKIVIAMNKFMAFYKISKIFPTHIYFVDKHQNSLNFLQYIFNICSADKLVGLEFIVHEDLIGSFNGKKESSLLIKIKKIIFQILFRLFRLFQHPSNSRFSRLISYLKIHKWKRYIEALPNLVPPKNSSFIFVNQNGWLDGGEWSNSISDPLFHYRGSLTSVLNLITIKWPNNDVYLVGTDFYGNKYFFEDELQKVDFNWNDWTTSIIKEKGKHFSVIDYKGTTMFDKFNYIHKELKKRSCNIFCINPDSELVIQGNVEFKKLPL